MSNRMHAFSFPQMRDELNRTMSQWLGDMSGMNPVEWGEGRTFPALNIWEAGDDLLVEAELPGLKPEHLEITVVGDQLTLKGERPASAAEGTTFHRQERGVGKFCRVVKLPVEVDADRVQAAFRDGVLEIKLPKAAAARPRRVQVATG